MQTQHINLVFSIHIEHVKCGVCRCSKLLRVAVHVHRWYQAKCMPDFMPWLQCFCGLPPKSERDRTYMAMDMVCVV